MHAAIPQGHPPVNGRDSGSRSLYLALIPNRSHPTIPRINLVVFWPNSEKYESVTDIIAHFICSLKRHSSSDWRKIVAQRPWGIPGKFVPKLIPHTLFTCPTSTRAAKPTSSALPSFPWRSRSTVCVGLQFRNMRPPTLGLFGPGPFHPFSSLFPDLFSTQSGRK